MLASLLQKGLDLKVTCGRAWKVLGPFKMRGGVKAHYIKQLEAHPLGKGGLEKYVHYQERNRKAVCLAFQEKVFLHNSELHTYPHWHDQRDLKLRISLKGSKA